MIQEPTLFMILLGCKPEGRHTEQHDIFFSIGHELKDLVEDMHSFWPEANRKLHIDAWRTVSQIGAHRIRVVRKHELRNDEPLKKTDHKLYFLNLGGYKPDDFEEYHYKILVVADSKAAAIRKAKESAFFRHQLSAHVDDQYGVDVDDHYALVIESNVGGENTEDPIHPGYIKLSSFEKA
jgi:hypothetical protein